jgi:hypothetical protein
LKLKKLKKIITLVKNWQTGALVATKKSYKLKAAIKKRW